MAFYVVKPRPGKSGDTRYICTVKAKEKGEIVYNKSRTFSLQATAEAYGKQEVARLERDGVKPKAETLKLREVIGKFLDGDFKLGRTKRWVLDLICDSSIGERVATELTPNDIVEHCRERRATASPATIAHDVSYLRWVLKMAPVSFAIPTDESIVTKSYAALHAEQLIGKSAQRSRRPIANELEKLKVGLKEREERSINGGFSTNIPFNDILEFSILSCMRIGEICRIRWDDVDEKSKAVIVRDRKDPRKKAGNHMTVPLLGGAWDLVMKQPKTSELIFPFDPRSVTAGFQRVRKAIGIEDLRYHDLRREGASRLFEKGFAVHEVAQVTGHRNLNTLWKIYTELYPESLHKKLLELETIGNVTASKDKNS